MASLLPTVSTKFVGSLNTKVSVLVLLFLYKLASFNVILYANWLAVLGVIGAAETPST